MPRSKKPRLPLVVWLILILVVGIGGLLGYRALTMPSDRELILRAIDESIAASREGRVGGVLEHLSNSLQINDVQYSRYQRELADAIKRMKPNAEIEKAEPQIDGNRATVKTTVRLSISIPKFSITIPAVTIALEKEPSVDWFVIPSHKWRVTGIDIPSTALEHLNLPFNFE